MNNAVITIAAILLLAAFYVLIPRALHVYQLYRQRQLVRCPETGTAAEIDIDARRAAFSSAFGRALLKVRSCSLWPKKKGCDEGCLRSL